MVTFRDIHSLDAPLLLSNARDISSALAFATARYAAIGTTSFAVSASAGRPDGIFVPGATSAEGIRAIGARVTLPLNVLAHPTLSVAELGELGVRRVSPGSLPYRAAVDAAVGAVDALRTGRPAPAATTYRELQERLVAFQ